ncbi:transcription factor 21-like isoform X2 [Argiope bruennichi]|uniref:transcription factor 21-like isoform X2 n=1 Tax=Argiope bruennichi TaxID=94029 RepID=UPI0024956053|nr:transcription factor 21-like isoform X2 [Argiope bruennichi]XP_055934513.1 transcription factor 21-like isoform X2 [Argiope bruennichi]XP_055934514.1 transcription factor 21-like isoform X2 [Argiope bruennichi]XP_055934515.1 transcription factor 21-like isoform X2 [Argiope bruennichi]
MILSISLAMAKRRRQPSPPSQEDSTSDLDSLFFPTSAVTSPEKPVQRNAANARERARMRVLSRAFSRLKTSLPWVPPDTKLSKLDTLRLAATYIAHLRKILKEDNDGHTKKTVHPLAFTWPFTINSRIGCDDSSPNIPSIDTTARAEIHDTQSIYENYTPCEYMTINYSDQPRRELFNHYQH